MLMISYVPRFVEEGEILGLVLRNRKITSDVNSATIKGSGIRAISHFLNLSTIVRTDEG